jgi:hypothetical protein
MGTQQAPSPQPSALVAFASRHALAIIACVYLALALALSFALPLGEAADEVSHRAYVAELTLHHHPPAPTGPAAGESFHPPLYYMLVSALTAWIPGQNLAVQANPDFSLDHPDPPNLLLHPASESFP